MTSGKSQVHWAEKGNRYTSDVVPIDDQVNSNGAGDYFASAFINSMLQINDLELSIKLAHNKTIDFLKEKV
jgi:sugar/nucleoside kinase (ribokinase family)